MTDDIRPPTLGEMADYLLHYGVKGMKWGQVRSAKGGGGSVKVAGRPTYTVKERRDAQKAVKTAKKSGAKALDKEGFDQTRVAKVLTPQRRITNAFLGTKYQWGAVAGSIAAATASIAATGGVAAPVGLAIAGATTAANVHVRYKVFFQNLTHNPKVRAKVKLTADEMAKYSVGRQFAKQVKTEQGSVKLSSMKGVQKLEIFDKEGRNVGGQTRKVVPPKSSAAS